MLFWLPFIIGILTIIIPLANIDVDRLSEVSIILYRIWIVLWCFWMVAATVISFIRKLKRRSYRNPRKKRSSWFSSSDSGGSWGGGDGSSHSSSSCGDGGGDGGGGGGD